MTRSPRKSRITKTVGALSEQAQQAAAGADNPLEAVIASIKAAARSDADPYLLVGVLLEAIVQVLTTNIPPERRPGTELATLMMLRQRLARPQTDRNRQADACGGDSGSA
jgi:hypothetical protein